VVEGAIRQGDKDRSLVVEFTVGILAEQSLSDSGGSGVLEKSQSGVEGVINLDLAIAANDNDTAIPRTQSAIVGFNLVKKQQKRERLTIARGAGHPQ
jgi:hypothetical protein